DQPRRRWRPCHRPASNLIAGHPLSSSSLLVPGLGFSPFERRRQLPETATTPLPRQPPYRNLHPPSARAAKITVLTRLLRTRQRGTIAPPTRFISTGHRHSNLY
ncbi:hypothetical protein V8G54_037924, partial (chloroplast) [Vigna mungo]